VTFGDTYGEITAIGLRAVRLKTLDDNEVTIPNAKFMSEYVSSGNSGALDMMVVSDFHIDLSADIAKAKTLLYQVVATSRFVFLKKPIKILVEEVWQNYQLVMRLRVKAYVFDVRFEKDFQSDVFERGNSIFLHNQIIRPARALSSVELSSPD
jgi:small-conductance mechanosensitive channel